MVECRGIRIALAGLVLSACVSLAACADIVVSPLTIEVAASPAQTGSGTFQVRNAGTGQEQVTVSLSGYSLGPDGALEIRQDHRSLAPLLEFSPVTFSLEPEEKVLVTFRFTAPAESGDHWAIFFVEGSAVTPVAETSGQVQTTVGIKVRYGVKVIQRDPAAIQSGAIDSMELVRADPPQLLIRFQNTGTSVLRKATGRIEVHGVSGALLAEVALEEFTTLPGGTRELTVDIGAEDLPRPGDYQALCIIDFGGAYLVAGELQFSLK